jgi:hypothetical protein
VTEAAPGEVILRFEMGCTLAEFHRLLPAVAPVAFDPVLNQFSHTEETRSWQLRLINPRERAIAALRLPVVDVVLTFHGYAQGNIDSFMDRFLAHFRRGGG